MIALGGPKLKLLFQFPPVRGQRVSMIALGGPKLKLGADGTCECVFEVSMIALGGPKLKPEAIVGYSTPSHSFNDSTGWA